MSAQATCTQIRIGNARTALLSARLAQLTFSATAAIHSTTSSRTHASWFVSLATTLRMAFLATSSVETVPPPASNAQMSKPARNARTAPTCTLNWSILGRPSRISSVVRSSASPSPLATTSHRLAMHALPIARIAPRVSTATSAFQESTCISIQLPILTSTLASLAVQLPSSPMKRTSVKIADLIATPATMSSLALTALPVLSLKKDSV